MWMNHRESHSRQRRGVCQVCAEHLLHPLNLYSTRTWSPATKAIDNGIVTVKGRSEHALRSKTKPDIYELHQRLPGGVDMRQRYHLFGLIAVTFLLMYLTAANAQYPIMDAIAQKLIQKYHASSCEQLYRDRAQKKQPGPEERKLIELLHADPRMRASLLPKSRRLSPTECSIAA